MSNYVVTLSRQFASLGREIAQEMSKELQINFYDRDIVEATAARMGLPVSEVADTEESHSNSYFKSLYPLGTGVLSTQDELFHTQENIIRDLASKESCIIVGRCADVVLKDFDNVLNIRVFAPYEFRLKVCMEQGMDERTARKMIDRVDKSRDLYHKEYGGCEVTDHTDIMINTGRYGKHGSAQLLCKIVRDHFHLD